jgi:hypothetical protein
MCVPHIIVASIILRVTLLVLQFWDSPISESDVIRTLNKVDLKLSQLRRLCPGVWLDDEVRIIVLRATTTMWCLG